jgi:selenocysteine lyase/cysteine desulfurase
MVKQTLAYLSDVDNDQLVLVNVTLPITDDTIVAAVAAALQANPGQIAMATFSHITSTPGIILPVKRLAELCRAHGVLVFIDGAHAMGHIPLNVTDLGVDFYLSNGHKWLYSPKGSAFLWVRRPLQALVHPTVISEGYGQGFQQDFVYQGTRDYTPWLGMADAIAWRNSLGDAAIIEYMHTLAVQGGNVMAAAWGTEKLVDDSMIGAMVNVRLPTTNVTLAAELVTVLLNEYNTYLVAFPFLGSIYARVSAQIYLELSDFQWIASTVLTVLDALQQRR